MSVRGVETHAREVIASAIPTLNTALKSFFGVPGGTCRYRPSCSHYAAEAFRRYPLWRAALMSFMRVLRCNPWARGGDDPVR
ncbi:MAG: membrane protein insertion efficiency factor YidD [Chitinivibrionales bacterium]|nr:membrane protein insertion efficiency factor YidD [Chitinivibrionales bacterium]